MEPRIQYAKTSDGVSIAYWAIGSGEPYVITYSPGTGHTQLEWEIPEAKAAYLRLAERRTVVRLDWRNNGLSTRGVRDLSLEAHLLDLEAVLGRLDVSRYSLHGGTISSKVVIRYAADDSRTLNAWCFQSPHLHSFRRFTIFVRVPTLIQSENVVTKHVEQGKPVNPARFATCCESIPNFRH